MCRCHLSSVEQAEPVSTLVCSFVYQAVYVKITDDCSANIKKDAQSIQTLYIIWVELEGKLYSTVD